MSRPRGRSPRLFGGLLAAALLALLTASACSARNEPVRYVGRLVVVNPTAYDVNVDVRPAGPGNSSSWVALGMARHEAETSFEEVIDQGEAWVVRLGYGGEDGGEVSVRREELVRNRWRVSVPPEVAGRLAEQGVTPPP